VESIWFARELLSDYKKEKPGYKNSDHALGHAEKSDEARPPRERHPRQLFKTRAAKHAVIVFGDAFATEELGAFRTTRHRFAFSVVQTASVSQALHHVSATHEMIRGGRFTSSTT
jgi:hypothetical protein